MRRLNIKMILLYVLLFVLTYIALLFMVSPWLRTTIIMQHVEQFQMHQFSPEEFVENRQTVQPAFEDFEHIVEPDLQMVWSEIPQISSDSVIGGIVIDEVDIRLPILVGTTHSNLLVGATTIGHNLTMGEGNFALAGHHMTQGGVLFSRLLDISEDALIYVTDGVNVYTYQVVETAVIHQNEISVLEPTEVATITLITCDQPTVWTPNRFMVRGELIESSEFNDLDSSSVRLIQEVMSGSQVSLIERYAFTYSLIGIGVCSSFVILLLMRTSAKDWKKMKKST